MIKNIDVIFRNPYNYCNLRKIIYHQYLPMLIGIFDQMGAQSDRLRCEVCQNLFLRPMNTGFLRHAVATALTVYGIETIYHFYTFSQTIELQQLLPFTVLKRAVRFLIRFLIFMLQQLLPFTVLKLSVKWPKEGTLLSCNSSYRLRY